MTIFTTFQKRNFAENTWNSRGLLCLSNGVGFHHVLQSASRGAWPKIQTGLKIHDGEKRGFWAGNGMIFGVVYFLFFFVGLSNGKNKNIVCWFLFFLGDERSTYLWLQEAILFCKVFSIHPTSINLGGGFKYFLCSSLFGEDSHFD